MSKFKAFYNYENGVWIYDFNGFMNNIFLFNNSMTINFPSIFWPLIYSERQGSVFRITDTCYDNLWSIWRN